VKGVKDIADLAANDSAAKGLFDQFGKELGAFLVPFLKGFDSEMLVIGGNISNAWTLFGGFLERSLKDGNCNCSVELSKLREDAALLGSAYLLDDNFWKSVQHALPLM
jgi:glucokinase